jgi:hypothetical protein
MKMELMFVNVIYYSENKYLLFLGLQNLKLINILTFIYYYFLAYFGCFNPSSNWDLFNSGLSLSDIQSSPYDSWHPGQNYFALIPSNTIAKCVKFCSSKGFALAGLTQG